MRQILVNLLSNAIKFTPAGGRVTAGVPRRAAAATAVRGRRCSSSSPTRGEGVKPEDAGAHLRALRAGGRGAHPAARRHGAGAAHQPAAGAADGGRRDAGRSAGRPGRHLHPAAPGGGVRHAAPPHLRPAARRPVRTTRDGRDRARSGRRPSAGSGGGRDRCCAASGTRWTSSSAGRARSEALGFTGRDDATWTWPTTWARW